MLHLHHFKQRDAGDLGFPRIEPPRGDDSDHPLIDALKRKDFIAVAPLWTEVMLVDDLPNILMAILNKQHH